MNVDDHETPDTQGSGRLVREVSAWWCILAVALACGAELAFGWVAPTFDAVAHLFFEVPVLARVRHASQLSLLRGHLAVLATLSLGVAGVWPWLGPHARRVAAVFLIGYVFRATIWIIGGNLPLVPGDSCHYLEVATSITRGEGPVKHYVESFFTDYPPIRQGRGVLDDWATPLYAYLLAGAYRVLGVVPGRSLEETVGVAKGLSFLLSLLTLPALYAFGRRRFDREVGLGAMALLAILPVHVLYGGFALRESLVAFTALIAVWTLTEVWFARPGREAFAWAFIAGVSAGLAILARNTALVLVAGAWLYSLLRYGRGRIGPLLLWGVVLLAVIAPWAWATQQAYGQPFYSYTHYFQYNFSWAVHHYEKGNTRAKDFYTRANAPEIVRVKIKSLTIIAMTATMVFSLPLTLAAGRRGWWGGAVDRMVVLLAALFVAATLANIADVTQVAQLGRYYLPVFVVALPTAAAGLRDVLRGWAIPDRARSWLGVALLALLWSDPTWAYDFTWLVKPYQLHWLALREAGDWVKAHPEAVPPEARVMTWFPWEFRVASDRMTVLFPRNYHLARVDAVIRQYGVTHVLWGSFETPPHVEPEAWGDYLRQLRLGAGLTDDREVHASPTGLPYPVRLYRVR